MEKRVESRVIHLGTSWHPFVNCEYKFWQTWNKQSWRPLRVWVTPPSKQARPPKGALEGKRNLEWIVREGDYV